MENQWKTHKLCVEKDGMQQYFSNYVKITIFLLLKIMSFGTWFDAVYIVKLQNSLTFPTLK